MLARRWIVILLIIVVAGLLGAGAILASIELNRQTATDAFCTSCHSMAGLAADPHFRNSAHRSNNVGVVASCSGCHIPATNWFVETYTHAAMGLKDVIAEKTGDFSEAAWKARRAILAQKVRKEMRKDDSAACRSCHRVEAIKGGNKAALVAHALMRDKHMTCVDCHFNVAHASAPPPIGSLIPRTAGAGENATLLKYYHTWADSAFLAHTHAEKGVPCAACHADPAKAEPVDAQTCMQCHDPEKVSAATATLKPANPHNSPHYGKEADCNLCHHAHEKSENYCAQCHQFKFNVP